MPVRKHTILANRSAAILTAFLLLGTCLLCSAAHAGNRYALLIGINNYRHVTSGIVELEWAINDVNELEGRLRDLGYDVLALRNADAKRSDILGELNKYAFKLKPDDMFVIYFAGHGVRRSWGAPHTYWLTYESTLDFPEEEGIRLTHLLELVQDIKAKQKIVLLDHCFSGDLVAGGGPSGGLVEAGDTQPSPPAGGSSGGARGLGDGVSLVRGTLPRQQFVAEIDKPSSGLLVLAASGNEAFEIDSLRHGIFTAALLQALSSREASRGSESLQVEQLKNFLIEKVRQLSNGRQEVEDFVTGVNFSGWHFADKLPVGNAGEALQKRVRYSEKLNVWQREAVQPPGEAQWRGLDLQTLAWCEQALNNWVESFASPPRPLSPEDERIVNLISQIIDLDGSSITLGDLLDTRVAAIKRPPR